MAAMLKINCPLTDVSEVKPLIAAGADVFYAGLIPQGRGELCNFISRRSQPENNFVCQDALERTLEELSRAKKTLFLTINEHFYPDEVLRAIFDILDTIATNPGLGGVILADPSLVAKMSERYPALELVGSCGLNLFNSKAIRVFYKQGLRRVVLPRAVTLAEVAAIAKAAPNVSLESFILNDRCPNIDGLCSFVHCEFRRRKLPNQCKRLTLDRIFPNQGEGLFDPREIESSFGEKHTFEIDACGACALYDLAEAGVDQVKIVGRDRPLKEKLRDLRFVGELRDILEEEKPKRDEFFAIAQRMRALQHKKKCHRSICYFQVDHRSRSES